MGDYLVSTWEQGHINWLDLVDIAIVAFLIYEFLKLIRRTRAVQMVVGATLVVGLYYLSEWAPLPTVNWIISDMLGYIVFAAIVLFQADIRRALSNLGQAPFFRYLDRSATTDATIEEIVMAARMLAESRVGAIIVVERDFGLRNYVESGIPLDSTVSYDLLVSLFQTDSPLHDGAVIVQNDRVAAAACFLPLTVNTQVGSQLGARHRAALGLTEESDAIAIVVSEETGEISFALDGQVESNLTGEQLKSRLLELMLKSEREARRRVSRQTITR